MHIPIPLPRTKKGVIITLAVIAIILLGVAIFAYFEWSRDYRIFQEKGRPDFNTLTEDQLEAGMFVHGDIDLALGVYAESYETELGIRTSDESSSLYYLIPIFDRAGDGKIRYLITFHAEPEDFDTLDKIVAQTWSDEPITTRLTVDDGYIGLLPDKFKQYFLEWAHDDAFYENGSSLIGAKNIKFLGQMMKLPSKPGLSHFIHITGMILQSNQALTSHGGSAQRAYTGNDRPDTVDSLQSPDRRF